MLKYVLMLGITFGVSTASLGFAEQPMTLHPDVVRLNFRAPGRVCLLRDGRFACVAKGKVLVSNNDGRSWTPVGKIPAGPGPAVVGGLLIESSNGTLVCLYRDDAGLKLERTPDNLPLPGAQLNVWCVRSTDGGRNWSDHRRLIDGYCGAIIDGIGTRLGKIVIPLQELRYDPPRHVTVVFLSDDEGETWQRSDDLDIGGRGIEDGCFEATVAERADDRLVMMLRTPRERLWKSESRDSGVTWTQPVPTNISSSNSPAYLHSLKSGRLALIWNPLHPPGKPNWPRRIKPRYAQQPDSVYREELLMAFSSDGGMSWTKPMRIAKQPGAKLRYGYFFERHPGEIWLALRGQWLRIDPTKFKVER